MEKVLQALRCIRAPLVQGEYDLHALVAESLQKADIAFLHEAALGSRARIDFLCGKIGVEVKRGRPNKAVLEKQLLRYLQSDRLDGIVVVVERAANLPKMLLGKPVAVISLHSLWGIAMETGAGDTAADGNGENRCFADFADFAEDMLPEGAMQSPDAEGDVLSAAEFPLWDEQEKTEEPEAWVSQAGIENTVLQSVLQDDLPAFLKSHDAVGHTYGTLSYNARRKQWVIKGEPCVTEMAKRLFPGSAGARRGEARFTAHRRMIGDVNWLMQRYPLSIAEKDKVRFQDALRDAQNYYRQKERARTALPTAEILPDCFDGQLRPFQQTGVSFLNLTPRALLADEMGLGKTVQALASVSMRELFPVCVVVPPHLVLNWHRESQHFVRIHGRLPRIHVLKGLTPYELPEADIYIVHYLLLRGWKEVLPNQAFRAVVFDEIQELRRAGTDKYSAASLLAESCDVVMGLSGTPVYNHGGEIWNVVNILDFHFLGDWESFSREWCAGYGNSIVLKPDLLGDHLRREGLMLRRTKQEVLPELPEKRRLVQEIDADDQIYRQLMRPALEKLRRYRTDEEMTRSARALLEDQISQEERQATGVAKAPYVCQFVRALCDAGEKVLLFAHHHKVMDLYKKELSGLHPVFITGRETDGQKQIAVDRFMEDKTDLCCISLRAASGLNLQKATCVVFGELDWSPAVHSQAEDRAHRIGQKDSLLCYYLVSPRGSDADMQEALGLKVSQFMGLMGDRPQTEGEMLESASVARRHVEKLLKRLDTLQM